VQAARSMSYFSLLKPNATGAGSYAVHQCHINVWSLPGLLGHRPMIIDVGVLFSADGPLPVASLEMVIPARVVKQIDLSKEVLDSENARLIFGRHYVSGTANTLELKEQGTVRVVGADTILQEGKLDRLTDEAAKELTALRVKLAEVPLDATAYTRIRFVVDNSASLWRWNRVLGRRSGAIVDLRVHDPREGGSGANAPAAIHGRDLPIANLEAFFILPQRFHIGGQNPPLTYTRTLEGPRWRDYLRRGASGALKRDVLLVHRWSKRGEEQRAAVSSERPFRGYLQFERVPSLRAPSDLVLLAVAVVALSYATFAHANLRSGVIDAGEWLAEAAQAGDHALLAGAGLLALLTVAAKLGRVPKLMRRTKRYLKILEHRWFKTVGR
jgi:hypothetical protein